MRGSLRKRTGKLGYTWEIRVELPRDPLTKKRRQETRTIHGTKAHAEAELRRLLRAIETGGFIEETNLTLAQAAARFLDDVRARSARATFDRYEDLLRLHVIPALGDVTLSGLRPAMLQTLYAALLAGREGARPLAPRTVHHVHAVIKTLLGWAVRLQLVGTNVALVAVGPKLPPPALHTLAAGDLAQILDAARPTRWYAPLVLSATTGARRGEVLGLRWEHVDLENAAITISCSLAQTAAGVALKGTKTGISRTVPLAPLALDALRARKVEIAKEKLAAGAPYDDQGFVFADPLGHPITPHAYSDAFRKIATKANLHGLHLHDLRHAAASLMLGQGADVKTVATILGHSDAATTLRVYAHALPGSQGRVVATLDASLQEALDRLGRTSDGALPETAVSKR